MNFFKAKIDHSRMVSVIIPTLNAANSLNELLASLRGQSVIPCEIIVIDSSSTDDTARIAGAGGAKVVRIKREDFDHGGTRNLGASMAAGEIIVFLTQDALPLNDRYIENLTRPLGNPGIAAAFGRQIPRGDAKPVEKFARSFNYPDAPVVKGRDDIGRLGIKTFFLSNVCSSFRKKELLACGGFPERIIMNEDMLLVSKLVLKGYEVAYVPEAKILHSHNYTLIEQMKRYFDIGVSLSDSPWILEYAKAEGEGAKFLKEEIRYLARRGEYGWIAYAAAEAVFKYFGFKTGLNYRLIPNALRKKISMHSYHWE